MWYRVGVWNNLLCFKNITGVKDSSIACCLWTLGCRECVSIFSEAHTSSLQPLGWFIQLWRPTPQEKKLSRVSIHAWFSNHCSLSPLLTEISYSSTTDYYRLVNHNKELDGSLLTTLRNRNEKHSTSRIFENSTRSRKVLELTKRNQIGR